MTPFLSILVPVYRVEKYFPQCVDSILKQTFTDFELILVDDGSPDKCPQLCDEYAKLDKRVRVIHQKNGGLVSARKAALTVACGEYIAIVDSDDWIEPNMMDSLVAEAKKTGADIVVCDSQMEGETESMPLPSGIFQGVFPKERLQKEVYPRMMYRGVFYQFGVMPSLWNKMYRRSLLKNAMASMDNRICLGEDAAVVYAAFLMADVVSFLPHDKALYHYRVVNNSMSRGYDKDLFWKVKLLYSYMQKTLLDMPDRDSIERQLNVYIAYIMLEAVQNEFRSGNTRSMWEKYYAIKKNTADPAVCRAYQQVSLHEASGSFRVMLFCMKHHWFGGLTLLLTGHSWLKKRSASGR